LPHYDAVVVGSGFGGSVTAYRLAEAGRRVLLLERGKPYPPGSFPRIPRELARNFWDPSKGLHGLFDLWTFTGLEAIVSSGLGGGSLIYANVLLRKDDRWFVDEEPGGGYRPWPITREDLEPHYDEVERVLAPQTYPAHHEPYASTPKTVALREATGRLGMSWDLPNLAVTFANPGASPVPGEPIEGGERNLHDRHRFTCRLCGECDIGCNFGSKNTLDFNYLTRFAELGGEIRTRCEVRTFAPRTRGGGFVVRYVEHRPEREGQPTATDTLPLETVTADRLVLSAGTLGTTYLLLKNRRSFPALSRALGTRFCGNGDLLAFITGARAGGGRLRPLDPSVGPVITSAARVPDVLDGGRGRGFYVQDGGYPLLVDWVIEAVDIPGTARRAAGFLLRRILNALLARPVSNISGEIGALIGDARRSSTTMPLLGMGRDVPDGNMSLQKRFLHIDWTTRTSRAYFDRVRAAMVAIASAMGGRLKDNPGWYFKRVVTVHPLGGCPMGRNADEGVVDAYGQVFGHEGLSIADGSIMPGPVGPNPALTIAAMADRSARWMIDHPPRGR
jgi:cholesterol oxidase